MPSPAQRNAGSGGLREDKVEDAVQAAAGSSVETAREPSLLVGSSSGRRAKRSQIGESGRGARLEKIRKSQKSPSEWAHEPEESSPLGHRMPAQPSPARPWFGSRVGEPSRAEASGPARDRVHAREGSRPRAPCRHREELGQRVCVGLLPGCPSTRRAQPTNGDTCSQHGSHLIAAIIEEGWRRDGTTAGSEPCAPFMTGPVLLALLTPAIRGSRWRSR